MSKFLSNRFLGINSYVPGEQPQDRSYIKLNTNESPFPPSPAVLAAINATEVSMLNLYPDPDTREASLAICEKFGLRPENTIFGNGSDELLAFAFQAFCDSRVPAVYADITYGFYSVYARINCVESRVIPLDDSFNLVPSDYYNAGGTVFIANPNSPTGCAIPLEHIENIVRANHGSSLNCGSSLNRINNGSSGNSGNGMTQGNVVVVDEAYAPFGGQSAVPLIHKYDNLIVIHTMSKSKNLAGARIAYAMADSALISDLNTMKFSFNPYNVNRLSLIAAVAAINDAQYYDACVEKLVATRERTVAELTCRKFTVLPSKANFIFAKPLFISGEGYYRGLKERGVLVRHFTQTRIKDFVRITIGSDEQMDRLLAETDDMMRNLQRDE